jgi:hypothetical protein
LTQQTTGERIAFAQATHWPQYRKFSAAPSTRQIVGRALAGAAIAAVVAFAWTAGDRMDAPSNVHVVTFVTFPRVTITAKRESGNESVAANKSGPDTQLSIDPAAIKLVKGRQ